ncbi:MAG: hypothetical protein JJU37_14790 [Balneolaceae bacterium]|nr:hypothetical protein [Balneolaceae bacterium]
MNINPHFRRVWQLSLLSFIIASVTGFLYRYGMLYPLADWLNFANIRHAHSHLMFFNWVSPPIMVWMASSLINYDDKPAIRNFSTCLYTMLFLGALSFPFFLLYGYHSVPIGSANLPIAAILSGMVMITWYWFARLYIKVRKNKPGNLSVLFFDAALLTLMISSLGAWGVSLFQFTDVQSPLFASALTHFFLATFTEGWALLGILGILWALVPSSKTDLSISAGWLWAPILFGSMMVFPFSLTQSLVTPVMLFTAKTGLFLIVLALTLNVWFLLKAKVFFNLSLKIVLLLLILKILFQAAAILPLEIWPGEHGLRVFYLHLLLLGIISITLFEGFIPEKLHLAKSLFALSALLVIISLGMISGYWPIHLMLPDTYFWILIIAGLPTLPATVLWIYTLKN